MRPPRRSRPSVDLGERALAWAERRTARVRGHNPYALVMRVGRQALADRVPGLSAEMAFFALLSFAPLIIALGAGLGYLERLIGQEAIVRAEAGIVRGLGVVFSREMTDDVLAPLVEGLLAQQRTGIAVTGLLATLWLASRVFTATIRALDLAYGVEKGRNVLQQRALALLFALASVGVVTLTLGLMVVGPLLGSGQALAARLGYGRLFAILWSFGRWPVLLLIVAAFLIWIYRTGPNVVNTWRECVPGALLGVALWILVSIGFRVYLAAGGPETPQVPSEEELVAFGGRVIGAGVAGVIWVWVSGMVILVGGELNAELAKSRARMRPAAP